jgi:23S rRNA-/tRNA-specific pseudouridylate synthase
VPAKEPADPRATLDRVLFANEHVVAANKPGGVLTVPSRTGDDDPRACFGRQLEAALDVRLWPVHRLDFEVEGVVLFAKHGNAHRIANAAFEARRVDKRYEALSEGAAKLASSPLPVSFTWESLLVRGKRRSFEAPYGKESRTNARAVALQPAGGRLDTKTSTGVPAVGVPQTLVHWELAPETGRPHQLRVHLAKAGFPVAGDVLYGAVCPLVVPDLIALRSVSLEFLDESDRNALGITGPLRVPGLGAVAASSSSS